MSAGTGWRRLTPAACRAWQKRNEDKLDDLSRDRLILAAFQAGAEWSRDPRWDDRLASKPARPPVSDELNLEED